MGIVAVARIAIERDRVYSYGYAAALGLATLVVMVQLVDSFLFCIFILIVVGYLADLIVRDCTLIDEDVDASGEGLIDSGHLFLKKQMQESNSEQDDSKTDHPRRKTSQPGRTVMYLALAALPLFGLGQVLFAERYRLVGKCKVSLGVLSLRQPVVAGYYQLRWLASLSATTQSRNASRRCDRLVDRGLGSDRSRIDDRLFCADARKSSRNLRHAETVRLSRQYFCESVRMGQRRG